MNGIDDLRRTLDDHASGVVDHELTGRTSAVRARVDVVRRRRRAVAAGGTAAVLAVVAGVALLPGGDPAPAPGPADTVVGVTPPAQLDSLGFTYAVAEGVDGEDGKARLRLEASDEPRLVSWATSGEDDAVRVASQWQEAPLSYDTSDFADWIYVPEGTAGVVKVAAADGDPGLVVYTLTDDRPAGLTKDGVTFRQSAAGRELLDATVGDRGEARVSVAGTPVSGGVELAYYCSGGPDGAWLHLTVGGEGGFSAGRCDDNVPVDATNLGGEGFDLPAQESTFELYVTDGEDGPVISDPDVQIGLGVYDAPPAPVTAADLAVPSELEDRGHTWRLDRLVRADPGSDRMDAPAPRGLGPVLAIGYAKSRDSRQEFLVDGRSGSYSSIGGGVAFRSLLNEGATAGWRLTKEDPDAELAVAFYVRAD